MAIQQPRWVLPVALALALAVPRAALGQSAAPARSDGWSPPVYPPPAPPSQAPAPSASPPPGYWPPAYAPPPTYSAPLPPLPPPPPPPEHRGFFLRLHFGPGFDSFSGGSTQLSGQGISFALAMGGRVASNLAVFGNFFESGALELSTFKSNRTDLIGADNAAMSGLGAGAVYYFEPLNLYVSGAVALTVFFLEDAKGKTLTQTNGGVGFEGMVGKEWWVSQHWGVGGALEIIAASAMKDQNDPSVKWSAEAFNVVISGTYF